MKTIATLSVALATLTSSPTLVAAQGVSDVQTRNSAIQTSLIFQASNSDVAVMSFEEVQAITQSAIRQAISGQLEQITADEVNAQITSRLEELARGRAVSFGRKLASCSRQSISGQFSMNVVLHYRRRPLGGILIVRVELAPAFCGLETAIRPIAVREAAEAVDNLDPDEIAETVSRLSYQLGIDYASK